MAGALDSGGIAGGGEFLCAGSAAASEKGGKRVSSWDVGATSSKISRLLSGDAPTGTPLPPGSGLMGNNLASGAAPLVSSLGLPGTAFPDAAAQRCLPQVNGGTPAVAAWVPTERIGDVLGLRGAIIQRIKQLSGAVQVHIHEEAGRAMTPVQVAGSPEAVAKVSELVQAVLDGRHESIGYVRQVFEMPEKMRSSLAGPVGHVLKRVSAASGAWVQQPDAGGPLVITGMPETVAQAHQLLLEEGNVEKPPPPRSAAAPAGPGTGPAQSPARSDGIDPEGGGPRREQLLQQLRSHLESAGSPGATGVGSTAVGGGASAAAAGVGLLQSFGLNPPLSPGAVGLSASADMASMGGVTPAGAGLSPADGANSAAGLSAAASMVAHQRPGAGTAAASQIITAHFEIPAQRVKDVLGVKGRNVKALKAQSGIQKINIMDRSDPATVTVTGTPTSIETCRFMVLSIAAGDQSVIGNVVEHMEIDQRIVSKFIGPKGQVISQIKDQSGAYLEVRETGGGQPPRIIMTGPPDCVVKARDLITQFLAENGVASSMLSMSGGRGADPYAQYYAQAKLQEAQIHAQLQEAQLQAQLQEVQLQQAQVQAEATAQLQAQLQAQAQAQAHAHVQAQSTANSFGSDLQALYAQLAQTGGAGAVSVQHSAQGPPQQPQALQLLGGSQQPQQAVPLSSLQAQPLGAAGQLEAQNLLSALEAIEAQRQGP